jgi:hypothetical protein
MGHNCGTCQKEDAGCACYEPSCEDGHEMQWSQNVCDQHPCAHGEAVVASAVAGVEFGKHEPIGIVYAHHVHDGWHKYLWTLQEGGWFIMSTAKYCEDCGLLLPTIAQLPEMYERWQAANSK